MNKPNLFIVGAPKCGTTFLYHYLKQHPDIFFPNLKEPHFFGSDLSRRHGAYDLKLDQYEELFNIKKKVMGEASTFYIFSETAAKEIHTYNPDAKIIIMIRNLVDLAHSLHSQFVFSGDEIIENFEEALRLESDRLEGNNIPEQTTLINKLFYSTNILSLPRNIQSFIDCFGGDKIKFILLDEIKSEPKRVYTETLKFLDVDADVEFPNFKIINSNKYYKSKFIRDFIKKNSIKLGRLRSIFLKEPLGIIRSLENLNRLDEKRVPMSYQLKK